MKRLLSLVLSAILVLASFLTVSAASENEVTVTINDAYSFTVTVKAEETDRVTLRIFPLSGSEGSFTRGNIPVYVGQDSTPDSTDPVNTYTITGSFLTTQVSGWFRAETNRGYCDFYYVSPAAKATFYSNLIAADAAGVEAVIDDAVLNGNCDLELYGYTDAEYDKVREYIDTAINDLDDSLNAATTGLDSTDPDDIPDYIAAVEDILVPELSELFVMTELLTAGNAEDFASEVTASATGLSLDLTYYNCTPYYILPATVYNRLAALDIPEGFSLTEENVQDMFDTAVLLAALDTTETLQVGNLTTVIDYYDGKCVTLDTTYSSQFTDEEVQDNTVSGLLRTNRASITSAAEFEAKYLEYSEDALGNGTGGVDPSPSPNPRPNPSPAPSAPSTDSGKTDEPESGELSDLGEAEWAKEAIEALVKEGVLAGKGDGKFYPNDTVTREEFIKIIAEAFELTDKNANAEFSDVAENRWSYKYIASGYAAGIITGVSETEFNPAGEMTRENMAVIIYRVAQYLGYELSDDDGADFADITDVADYSKEAVKALCAAGVINGTGDNMFSPKGIVTRAQAAKIVYELLVAMGGIK